MSGRPKKHHVVPRVYLDRFKDEDGRVTVWSKRRGKELRSLPKDTLVRHHYYSQPVDGQDNFDQTIEIKLWNNVENNLSSLIQSIVDKSQVDLALLCETLLSMVIRSPAFREPFEIGLADYVDRQVKQMDKSDFPAPPAGLENIWDQVKVSIDPHRSIHGMHRYLIDYASKITFFSYRVLKAKRGSCFLTSDNPVVWFKLGKNASLQEVTPINFDKATRCVFPLDKKHLLYGKPNPQRDIKLIAQPRQATASEVTLLNSVQAGCCWDHLVGNMRLPKKHRDYYLSVAPSFHLDFYDPNTGAFTLSSVDLAPLRKKSKFIRR
ncbi:MAG: DUF4238 domain-containing protein [Pseudomonadota bacterium]